MGVLVDPGLCDAVESADAMGVVVLVTTGDLLGR